MMMALDPTIPFRVQPFQAPDQISALAQMLQLAHAQQGTRLADLQYTKLAQGMAEEAATKDVYARYLRKEVSLADVAATNPKLAQEMLKQEREAVKTDSEIAAANAKARLDNASGSLKELERHSQMVNSVRDQTTMDLARVAAEKAHPGSTSDWPERYDPAWVEQYKMQGVSVKDRQELVIKQREQEWKEASKLVDQRISQQNADSSRITAGAAVTSAGAAVSNARTNAGRLGLEQQKQGQPEGAPIEMTNKATGDKVLVYRTQTGQLLDANTRRPIDYAVAPKAENVTPEGASRVALMKQGRQDIEEAKKILFDDKGKLNKTTAFAMKASLPMGMMSGGWGEEGSKAYSRVYNAVSAKLRMETGAAAPQSEVDDIARRFMPSIFRDSDASGLDKLNRLQEFMDMGLEELERVGYVKPGTARSERAPDPTKFGLKPASK